MLLLPFLKNQVHILTQTVFKGLHKLATICPLHLTSYKISFHTLKSNQYVICTTYSLLLHRSCLKSALLHYAMSKSVPCFLRNLG